MELLDADSETTLLDTVYDYQPDYPDDASWPDFNKMNLDFYGFDCCWMRASYKMIDKYWDWEVNHNDLNLKWKMEGRFMSSTTDFKFSFKVDNVQQIVAPDDHWYADETATNWRAIPSSLLLAT